jgi:hypothetical protein
MAESLNLKMADTVVILNCNMAVYLNFKYGGIFKDDGKFKFKDGAIFEYD